MALWTVEVTLSMGRPVTADRRTRVRLEAATAAEAEDLAAAMATATSGAAMPLSTLILDWDE